jgi:ubiquitin carboxyl-terminal hydrolase 36/42
LTKDGSNASNHNIIPPKGMNNMGNTCFLNSTLQCLIHTIPLRNYLLSKIHSAKCKVNGVCPFCSLENFMVEYEHSNKKQVTPKNVVNNLKKSWKQYRFGRQEDAHEFLVMFLQGILRSSFGQSPKLTKKYEHLSMVYRIFAGKLRSQIK